MESTDSGPGTKQILAQAAKGDQAAWRKLVETYSPRVYALLLRQCGNQELAEEICQDTFVTLVGEIGNRQRYQERGRFESWVFSIAMNRLRDEARRRKRHAVSMDMSPGGLNQGPALHAAEIQSRRRPGKGGSSEVSETSGDTVDPFERVSQAEQIELLQRAVSQMNEADQKILHLRHTAGMSFRQIAEVLGQPMGTVLARGHRALSKLRQMLADPLEEKGEDADMNEPQS